MEKACCVSTGVDCYSGAKGCFGRCFGMIGTITIGNFDCFGSCSDMIDTVITDCSGYSGICEASSGMIDRGTADSAVIGCFISI